MARPKKIISSESLVQKYQSELRSPSSYYNLILGLLIVLAVGLLVFNYFKKGSEDLGPAQQAFNTEGSQTPDVNPGNLPGKYTVKEGDTLFTIAEKYYKDGFQFVSIMNANKLTDENMITVGQVLEIPKIEVAAITPSDKPAIGGAENQTIWGEKITGDTYVVVADDWLSKIAGRAYGDPMQFDKIAKANNISNVDLIEPGITLKIPR